MNTDGRYRIRETGEIVNETIVAETILRKMYQGGLGSKALNTLLNNRVFCQLYGRYQTTSMSRTKIEAFVRQHAIDCDEIELPLESYPNFNAFFSRKLKPSARPFDENPAVFCSPADGKVLVYPRLRQRTCIPVKGASVTVESLLSSKLDAQRYIDGSALVVRLAPYDYHRFHFPDAGQASTAHYIKGKYHSVNPIALTKFPDIYRLNKRAITELVTKNYGTLAYAEIGALTVGSIVQTYRPGPVTRGQEKGFFQFGGSTLVLLFEPNKIEFDADLINDSQDDVEVSVLAGAHLGKIATPAQSKA